MIVNKKIILASKSPRRQELIKGLEIPFEIVSYEVDESFDDTLTKHEIPLYLAQKKGEAFPNILLENEILLTADTIVWINNHVLNKPETEQEAFEMLTEIGGTTHEVFTGVCLKSNIKTVHFFDRSEVTIKQLNNDEIWHYIKNYKPFDKAGSYGIQDWFGYTAVEKINGCFYNVMGLPINKVYSALKEF
ncbi:MAG: Maf family nucleotide pyrophosphatase [Bacteroidota bacterium]|jgi:septum formation protein